MAKKLNFNHQDQSLKKALSHMHAYDIASIFERESEDNQKRLIHISSSQLLAEVFINLEHDYQKRLFQMLSDKRQKTLLNLLESDELKTFIEADDYQFQNDLLALLPKYKAKTIRLLLTYEADEAASMMSTDYLALNVNMSIKTATKHIVSTSKATDYMDSIFVVNDDHQLQGMIDIKDLIIARPSQSLYEIMDEHIPLVYASDSIEDAIKKVKDYDAYALPVIGQNEKLIGIITADDVFDEMIENYEDDYERIAQITDYESTTSALKRSKKRLPWLLIGVILNVLTIMILLSFGSTLEQVTALILFQPMILGQAGNIGTQALAVTILGIHQQAYEKRTEAFKHLLKEVAIGAINALAVATIAFVFVSSYLNIFQLGSEEPMTIALAVFIALLSVMIISAMMGSLVPIVLYRWHIDPASASGPLMTTINDIIALVVYFSIATLLFM